ncbi:MAG: hypothetical protein ACI9EK_002564 [Psychroserpens sp.]|jgi:hypothetical protein
MKGKDLLDISLKSENGNPVSLQALSTEALESFLIVVSSMKEIITSCVDESLIKFKIIEGSARCYAEVPSKEMKEAYHLIDDAIEGRSSDKTITRNLRNIQLQLKNKSYDYRFVYSDLSLNKSIQLGSRLKESNRITAKRLKGEYQYKLSVLSGHLNEVGGVSPNYHFDYGGDEKKMTIQCSKSEAIEVKKYLYTRVSSLLLIKEWNSSDKKNENYHISVIEDDSISAPIRVFLRKYNDNDDLISKLSAIYDFVEKALSKNKEEGLKVLSYLLRGFNNKRFHLSELKTLLVVSKPFINEKEIKEDWCNLLDTYENKKN